MSESIQLSKDFDPLELDNAPWPDYLLLLEKNGFEVTLSSDCVEFNPLGVTSKWSDTSLKKCIKEALEALDALEIFESVQEAAPAVVYTLDCAGYGSPEAFKREATKALDCHPDDIPSHYWAAYHAPKREYIGGTHRPEHRLAEHNGWRYSHEGATFTSVFPPESVELIHVPFSDSVYDLEERIADYWKAKDDPTFVYQN